ncbi:hypothetical protein KIPB_001326, partial [Kipferlia bialata]
LSLFSKTGEIYGMPSGGRALNARIDARDMVAAAAIQERLAQAAGLTRPKRRRHRQFAPDSRSKDNQLAYKRTLTLAERSGMVKRPPGPQKMSKWQKLEGKVVARHRFKCGVCMENVGDEQPVVLLSPCGHVFHRRCLFRYEKAAVQSAEGCPLCRQRYIPRQSESLRESARAWMATLIQRQYREHRAVSYASKCSHNMVDGGASAMSHVSQHTDTLLKSGQDNATDTRVACTVADRASRELDDLLAKLNGSRNAAQVSWPDVLTKACLRHKGECPICMDTLPLPPRPSIQCVQADRSEAVLVSCCATVFHKECLHDHTSRHDLTFCPCCRQSYVTRGVGDRRAIDSF